MPVDIVDGRAVYDQGTGLATTMIAALATGQAYFCDPRQDFSEWEGAFEPLRYRLVVDDTDGDQVWGHIEAAVIGIPFDNMAVSTFAAGNGITTGAGDAATIVAVYMISATAGLLIVTIANAAHSFDDNEQITDAVSAATADVDTSGGAGGGPSVTSATFNAATIYSLRRGGTQDWAHVDTGFLNTDTPLDYEVRGVEYQTVCITGLELGTTAANMTRLLRQGLPEPEGWAYIPYSRVETTGAGRGVGLGFPGAVWNWNHMGQAQANRLLLLFSSQHAPTADVHIWTYVDEGPKRMLRHFTAIAHRPVDGQGKAMVSQSSGPTYDNVVMQFTRLQEAV
jgi:hypothetical protein